MTTWYYHRISSSEYVKDPAKKHYIRSSLIYSFSSVLYNESYSTPRKGINYHLSDESSTREATYEWTGDRYEQDSCSGSAPFKTETTLSTVISGFVSSVNIPIFFGPPGYEPSGRYAVVDNIVVTVGYGDKKVPTAVADFSGGFIDFTKANGVIFGTEEAPEIEEQYTVSSGTFYYRQTGAGSYSSIAFTGDTLLIPSNTFASNKTYEAYATLVLDDGTTARYDFAEITTVDAIGSCIGVRPQNEVMYGDVVFQWNYSVSTGTAQKAYDLQISPDGETWTTIFNHVVSSEASAAYSQSISGNTYWRVRGYNQNDVAGSWSDPLFYINNVPPQPPVIRSITGNSRQTVAWSADAQIAYHLRVVDSSGNVVYDTGEVYSTSGSALVDAYLLNGTYTFRVRIATAIGGWSDWASMQKTVTATLQDPEFTLTALDSGVEISIEQIASSVSFLVYRNGELIGRTISSIVDYFVAGASEYRVVGVSSSTDKYGYSFQSISFAPSHNQIVTEDGEIFLVNRRLNERSFPQKSISPKYASYEFLGEDRPSHVFVDDFRSGTFTVAIYDKEGRAEDLLGKKVFFSTTAGWGEWCVVTAINRREVLFGNDVTITMELTSKPEITL